MKKIIFVLFLFIIHCTLNILPFFSSRYFGKDCYCQWVQISSGTSGGIVTSMVCSNNIILAGTTGSGLFRSTNNGTNWTQIPALGTSVSALLIKGNNTFSTTSQNGVQKSTDFGATWNLSYTVSSPSCLTSHDSSIYFGTNLGYVFRTTNDGLNWTQLTIAGLPSTNFFSITADSTFIFGGTSANGIYRTSVQGSNWVSVNNGVPIDATVYGLMPYKNIIFAATTSSSQRVYCTSNYGGNWIVRNNGLTNAMDGITFNKYGSTLLLGMYNGFFISFDTGNTWISKTDNISSPSIYSITYNSSYIFVGTYTGYIWRRPLVDLFNIQVTYSRNNINKIISPLQITYDTINANPADIYTNSNITDINISLDTVINTFDGHLEFTLIHQGIYDTIVYHAGSSGNNFIGTTLNDSAITLIGNGTPPFTGSFKPSKPLSQFNGLNPSGNWILKIYETTGNRGGVIKAWSIGISYNNFIGIRKTGTEIPIKFTLYQNFPNPFNPSTIIRYSIPENVNLKTENSMINLKVYDLIGKEIATLVNEKQFPGTYEVEFNGSKFSSGVYFYKLIAGNFTDTKRMVIIK